MVRIDFDDFCDLAYDRLNNFWGASDFELECFDNYVDLFDECDIDSIKSFVDNFHANNFMELDSKKEYQKFKEEGYYTYANKEEGRYAVVY